MSQITDQTREAFALSIRGVEGLQRDEIERLLAAGARFVFFETNISLVAVTLRRPTAVYLVRHGERAWLRSLPYCLVSLLLGWWGIPWGVIYTPLTIVRNLAGGCDVTREVWEMLGLTNNEH